MKPRAIARGLATGIGVLLIAAGGTAAQPAPADTAAADVDEYLRDLESRTDEEFSLEALTISDAEVDSLIRALDETGVSPYEPPAPRWDLDLTIAELRYTRVEGTNLMPEATLSAPTRFPLTAFARGGYGWASKEATWRGGLRVASARTDGAPFLELRHARDIYAYGSGGVAGNSLVALATGKDWSDYFRGEGWSASCGARIGRARAELEWRAERQESVVTKTRFTLFEGRREFRENPAIDDGRLRSLGVTLSAGDAAYGSLAGSLGLVTAGNGLGGDFDYHRLRAEVVGRRTLWFGDQLKTRLTGGLVGQDPPYQALHLLGGTRMLRGYDVNELPTRRFAHLAMDYAVGTDLLGWVPFVRRLRLQAVPFLDAAALFQEQAHDGTVIELDEPRWRFSAGVGIQQNLFGLPGGSGQLRVDIARRLDREDDAVTYRFGFTLER